MQGKKAQRLIYLFIFILGLIPLLWFKGELITGTDVDFPLYPKQRLIERIYAWYPEIQLGTNRSNNLGSIPYYFVTYLFSTLNFSIVTVEKLVYVFWFMLTGFSINYLMGKILKGQKGDWVFFAKLFAILFYMVNFYNIFLWVRLQLAVTILIALPVLLGVLLSILNDNRLLIKDALLLAIGFVVAGAFGIQPPIIYAVILVFLVLVAFYLIIDISQKKYKLAFSKIKKLTLVFFVMFFSSSYWLIPLINFVFGTGISSAAAGREIYDVEALLGWTSRVTSFKNMFRSFGDVVWFDGWKEAYFPEFLLIFENPFFTIASFIIPFAVIGALFFRDYKNKKKIVSLTLVALTAMFFSKGIHDPFSSVFKFLFNNLPGFWIHRAPWQKFGLITILCFSVLGGIGLSRLIELGVKRVWDDNSDRKIFTIFGALLSFIIYIAANWLFVAGVMFPSKDSEIGYHGTFDLGFHHTFPDYAYEAGKYFTAIDHIYNVLVLPDMNANVYEWGFAGSTDALNLLTNKGVIYNPYGEGFTVGDYASLIYQAFAKGLYGRSDYDYQKLLGFFNIEYILQRNDFSYDFFGDTDSPAFIKRILDFAQISKHVSFGSWDVYKIEDENIFPAIYTAASIVDATNVKGSYLKILEDVNYEFTKMLVSEGELEEEPEATYVIVGPEEVSETIKEEELYWESGWDWPKAINVPNTIFYPFVRVFERVKELKCMKLTKSCLDVVNWHASKRITELAEHEKLKEKIKNKLFNDFVSGHERIIEALNKGIEGGGDASAGVLRKSYSYFQQALITISDLEHVDENNQELVRLNEEYSKLFDEQKKLECLDICYEVEILRPGLYEMDFVLERDSSVDFTQLRNTTLTIKSEDGQILHSEEITNKPGNYFFEKGEYIVHLKTSKEPFRYSPIYLENVSLEQNDNLLGYIGQKHSNFKNYTPSNIKRFTIDGRESVRKYNLSFDFEIQGGFLGVAMFEEKLGGDISLNYLYEKEKLDTVKPLDRNRSQEKSKFNVNVQSSISPNKLHFYIFSYSPKALNTKKEELSFSNLNVGASFVPNLVLRNEGKAIVGGSTTDVVFYKEDPTKYKVMLNDTTEPFYLVFNQTFDKGWNLYKGGKFDSKGEKRSFLKGRSVELKGGKSLPTEWPKLERISKDSHLRANYFANAWYVDPSELGGEKVLTIEFYPQRLFYVGALISTLTILSLGILYFVKGKHEE